MAHLPTGVVVSCQNEKSYLQNKESALRVLRARLHALAKEAADAEASAARRSQVRTVDRSERIRTYNYPENRISDHRTGYKSYNLDAVLDGDLEPVVQSAVDADEAAAWLPSPRAVTDGQAAAPDLRAAVRAATARLAQAGSPRPRATPSCWRPTPSASRSGTPARRWCSAHPSPRHTKSLVEQPPASRCSTSPAGRASGASSSRWGRASSCRGRRPRSSRASPSTRRGSRGGTGGRRPVHRVGGHRPQRQGRGAAAQVYAASWGRRRTPGAARNRSATGLDITLVHGDATTAFPELDGQVDVVVSNPPYIPVGMVPIDPEVREHDPDLALYGGSEDGLAIPLAVAARRRLCCGPAACSSWSTPTPRAGPHRRARAHRSVARHRRSREDPLGPPPRHRGRARLTDALVRTAPPGRRSGASGGLPGNAWERGCLGGVRGGALSGRRGR